MGAGCSLSPLCCNFCSPRCCGHSGWYLGFMHPLEILNGPNTVSSDRHRLFGIRNHRTVDWHLFSATHTAQRAGNMDADVGVLFPVGMYRCLQRIIRIGHPPLLPGQNHTWRDRNVTPLLIRVFFQTGHKRFGDVIAQSGIGACFILCFNRTHDCGMFGQRLGPAPLCRQRGGGDQCHRLTRQSV